MIVAIHQFEVATQLIGSSGLYFDAFIRICKRANLFGMAVVDPLFGSHVTAATEFNIGAVTGTGFLQGETQIPTGAVFDLQAVENKSYGSIRTTLFAELDIGARFGAVGRLQGPGI